MLEDVKISTPMKPGSKAGMPPIAIIGMLFFVFGFITWLNSVLIPYLKIACELNNFESYLVAFSFYIAYLIMAIPAGIVLKSVGFKKGMSLGLLVIAVGALIFIPAAITRTYGLFLFGLFVQGTGLAVLQTASNPYVTILGPIESAAKRISIMGICNKIAGAIAPIVIGAIALKNVDGLVANLKQMTESQKATELSALASRVIMPYSVIVIVLVILAALVYFSSLPEIDTDKEDDVVAAANKDKSSIFQFPHLLLGVLTLFLYVGVEVLAGDSIISYGASQHIPLSTAKFFTTCTLIAMIVGYIIGIVCIPKYISQHKALTILAVLGVIFSISAILTHGYVSVLCIALLGLSNSLMWPAIWPLALSGLGRFTKIGSSLLIMAIAGGALIPLLYGSLVDKFGNQQAYWILVPCYLMIFYYASYGHMVGKKRLTTDI
jgi:FHS family L-fucose permease-like MFS transporter